MAAQWLPQLRKLLPLDDAELTQIIDYMAKLPADKDEEAANHLQGLLGDSPEATAFVADFVEHRGEVAARLSPAPPQTHSSAGPPTYSPPAGPPPGHAAKGADGHGPSGPGPNGATSGGAPLAGADSDNAPPPPPSYHARAPVSIPVSGNLFGFANRHTNALIEASNVRARDEQEMQNTLQNVQLEHRIYNPEIEPEHESDYYCNCSIHQYYRRKIQRLPVQRLWCNAVMYPGEKFYSTVSNTTVLFGQNPYMLGCGSPFGYGSLRNYNSLSAWGPPRPSAYAHMAWTQSVIRLSNDINRSAQAWVDSQEPKQSIWDVVPSMAQLTIDAQDDKADAKGDSSTEREKPRVNPGAAPAKKSKFAGFKKSLGIKSSEEKAVEYASSLRASILAEEAGRWPNSEDRKLVANYQDKVGMTRHIADLRARKPIQYLHLLRAGYFEPIPVAWATQTSNPLKFSVEASEGWRGITPAWRGYEDLAEERLYWVLNHREGSVGMRMKPDFISEMNMAQQRMANAVEPPPMYFSPDDTCMRLHTTTTGAGQGYSKQVMPAPFRAFDKPETPSDDSMILLDVSGSMDFDPVRPVYDRYLITGYARSTQPKNKDVAKSIVRRFTDALAHHDHQTLGYDLVTFANQATYIGAIHHRNFDAMWRSVRVGGGTRVMTGWQKVKDMHFQKHRASAVAHPVYGWQAGPDTPMLRLLLFLDGEATDMDEFELDLLGLSWAHVTIFLIGVDNCPHHHRHANELQRISDVNHHVSFVDAQGNCPERFVTHELLKRHLGYDMSLQEFEAMEQPPAYAA
ncbi:hypothetical protein HMPREF1624_05356 [Sporothrix schenckii ATCC 58251]|uniref:VWFA domain-containing protein n=1 Tax=Sporothrix schenckii (strain ATCC 58251 / de Perez 2211183) TaxID=1391915 RepID=U7PUG1_SPOS1|nr:hypothetical protein HMPREF1624_05356 [Sporothrix schenckii ATCC 58251]